jgi:ABC-type nitrate/sulfonate/bicarbonate transport system substrate-binding protein
MLFLWRTWGGGILKQYFKQMNRLFFFLVVVLVIGAASLVSSCHGNDSSQPPENISVGFTSSDTTVLLLIADNQGFFAANGLNATLKVYDTALNALAGMKNGEVDIAENAEFPIVSEAFHKSDIRVIAGVDRFDIVNLALRKDRGINSVADLKGKTIGVPKGAVAEFYFGRFLQLNGISLDEVKIVNLPFQQAVDALPGGTTDAFLIRNRDIDTVKARLNDNVTIMDCQNGQLGYDVLSARKDWITNHSETSKKLVKTMLQAESFVINHHKEAFAIIQERLKFNQSIMDGMATHHIYSVSLDQSFIVAMEDEARWMIKNRLTPEKEVPLFNNYIYEDALKTAKPGAVNIIR